MEDVSRAVLFLVAAAFVTAARLAVVVLVGLGADADRHEVFAREARAIPGTVASVAAGLIILPALRGLAGQTAIPLTAVFLILVALGGYGTTTALTVYMARRVVGDPHPQPQDRYNWVRYVISLIFAIALLPIAIILNSQ